jgi:2-haloacid dehalogenase
MGGAAFACAAPFAAGPPASSASPGPHAIRAVAFDLFTLFDPRGVDQRVVEVLGLASAPFASNWKSRLFEYSWLRAASGQYRSFDGLVGDALSYAARAHHVELSATQRAQLEGAFTELAAWPDSAAVLGQLRARGLKLAPLANFSPRMIDRLLRHAGLAAYFDDQISTDRAQTYKPDPRAYALAEAAFALPRNQIAFSAFGGWDAAGARWFGFPTFWVNRLAKPAEELVSADAAGPDLGALMRWLEARPA